MKKKYLLYIGIPSLILIIILTLIVFKGNGSDEVKYKTEALKKGNIEALVNTTGTVNPVTIVEVGSQVSGRILKIHVDFNSRVTAGQLVAEIDPSQIETRIKQNEANYESSKATLEKSKVTMRNQEKKYKRALQLFERELISYEEKENLEVQFKTAQTDVQVANARALQSLSQLDSSKVDLSYTKIRSPIDGVVILRNINVGQTVAASFQAPVLFQIANDLKKMQVECSIDEADIGQVKDGMEVKFTVDAFPGDSFTGSVTQVRYSPEVVQNVVTYTTIVATDNSNLKLRPGMTATVSIVTGKATDVLMVSNSALRFNPPLSQEQMREMFTKMREEMMKRRGVNPGNRQQGGGNRTGMAGRGFSGNRQPGAQGQDQRRSNRRRNSGRVWILDENQQLQMVMIRTGVTDENYTEIRRAELKEGQLIITGILSGDSSRSDRSNLSRSSRMFFRR